VRLDDVDDDDVDIVAVAVVEILGGGTRPPEGWSGEGTED
jgi:hypothetical protein